MPNRHLSLAIGKEGQNARLAAKLCGWAVDIKSDMDVDLKAYEKQEEPPSSEIPEAQEATLTDEELYELVSSYLVKSNSALEQDSSTGVESQEVIAERIETADVAAKEISEILQTEAQKTEDNSEDALTPEEELLLLELEEGEKIQITQPKETAAAISELPEDIWSIHRSGAGSSQPGSIRFAEDIDELKSGVTGRRERRGGGRSQNKKRGQGNNRRRR